MVARFVAKLVLFLIILVIGLIAAEFSAPSSGVIQHGDPAASDGARRL